MTFMSVTPRDRLSFTLFFAAAVHAAVILGVSFNTDSEPPAPTIEVTLTQHADHQAPEEADFIAQSNQLGSGSEEEPRETLSREVPDFAAEQPQPAPPEPLPQAPPETARQQELLATETAQDDRVTRREAEPAEAAPPTPTATLSYDNLAQEIAGLEARIAEEQQASARRPRVKRLTSVSAKSAVEAAYLNAWRQRVERIGNANYPRGGVAGSLRLLVVLSHDGTLQDVRLLESSGHRVLDEAALRIVRMGAPYQSFPVEMRKKYDRLEIIRTWQFSRTGARLGR